MNIKCQKFFFEKKQLLKKSLTQLQIFCFYSFYDKMSTYILHTNEKKNVIVKKILSKGYPVILWIIEVYILRPLYYNGCILFFPNISLG